MKNILACLFNTAQPQKTINWLKYTCLYLNCKCKKKGLET